MHLGFLILIGSNMIVLKKILKEKNKNNRMAEKQKNIPIKVMYVKDSLYQRIKKIYLKLLKIWLQFLIKICKKILRRKVKIRVKERLDV